jgi:ribosomal protein L16/L10AE
MSQNTLVINVSLSRFELQMISQSLRTMRNAPDGIMLEAGLEQEGIDAVKEAMLRCKSKIDQHEAILISAEQEYENHSNNN